MRNAVLGAGAAATGLSMLAVLGSGIAAAATPDVVGKKYSDAQSAISSAGFTPVVRSAVGDQSAWSDCLVTRVQPRTVQPPANSAGSAKKELLVSLNCEGGVATVNKPGPSMGSPEGRAAAAAAAAKGSGG
jgi:hypothetical protein